MIFDESKLQAMAAKVLAQGEKSFAAAAWKGYEASERGAVLVYLERDQKSSEPRDCVYHGTYYISLIEQAQAPAALRLAIAHYDPERQFIFVISFAKLGHNGAAPWLTCTPALAPPEAFALTQQRDPVRFDRLDFERRFPPPF